ncbi:PEP-CTERM sorting domain-containing protein [uncultured Paludibaculum sp.]|uniref:PEP-CTERM sorting domain-containing protein n=1 Tax=uncultured Paludibaculum sp. TaxID=1765020 RepID=UPI002AABA763|nr:PEP-CTERM sorting domain-containing protein [uncultured Paludibaculum sp.]
MLVLISPAHAAVLTINFAGNLTQVPLDEALGDLNAGDPFQGSFSFDTSAADLIPSDPAIGGFTWHAPLGMTVTIGPHVFTALGSLNIGILNGLVDQYTVFATDSSGAITLELFLQDNSGGVFSGDGLPSGPPLLAGFQQKDFHLLAEFAAGEVQADGQLTTLASADVPEPGTAGLFLAGLSALFTTARHRRSAHSAHSR